MSIIINARRFAVLALLALPALAACGAGDAPVAEAVAADEGNAPARGSFSCDLVISNDLPPPQLPPIIERDRMLMADHPGLISKQLPIGFDQATGLVFSGGRYLFDTYEHASAYRDFVLHGYVLDGVEFVDRSYFLSHECHAWSVVGARSFTSIDQQVVMRTERFQVSSWGPPGHLHKVFDDARKEAERRGLGAVWLTVNQDEGLAQLVYYGGRVGPVDPTTPDFASLGALAGAPPIGDAVAPAGWTRSFDRTEWVLTVWFPFEAGDQGAASLWLNSPPFPAPFCGDGVCEPSRGETGASCAADCTAACGDGVCEAGEDIHACPSDCRL
jgi:hypothetical protein